jgi:2-methylisocitrate lyase-like PEP mutase family enzyme
MPSVEERARTFAALHQRQTAFVIPNPWDVGSARLLAELGFEALATSSAGYAFTLGQCDGTVGRERMLEHVRSIVEATDLPVSADLENGFGDTPEACAETIRLAAATGLAGGSIEDASGRPEAPIYDFALAVERVRAAVETVRGLPRPFTLTARAENFLHGRRDLADTIRRLQAYQEAGADVLYAPAISSRAEIAAVVAAVDRPVNVLALAGMPFTLGDFTGLGVRRVSLGSALARAAFGAALRAAREMREQGTFTFTAEAASMAEISALFR